MGLFGRNNILDVINCDDKDDYLIWKWGPDGNPNNVRANSIRYGSSLRVRDGQQAVFVYKQSDGTMQEFITGPYDRTIDTQNFPVLAPILGLAYGGGSPFQAEIYFINADQSITRTFYVDHIEVVDVITGNPTAFEAKCSFVFKIQDIPAFVKNHKLRTLKLEDLEEKVLEAMISEVKNTIGGVLFDNQIPAAAVSARRDLIINEVKRRLVEPFEEQFAIHLVRFDIPDIKRVRNGEDDLDAVLREERMKNIRAEHSTYRGNIQRNQDIAAENLQESLKVQREVAREGGILGARQANLGAYQVGVQGEVGKAAAEGLGQLGSNPGSGISGGSGGGMNPAAMMSSMMLGTSVGAGMSNMMGGMMNNLGTPQAPQAPQGQVPPPPPASEMAQWHLAVNGQSSGPYSVAQLRTFVAQKTITPESMVWKAGMAGWAQISTIPELASLFGAPTPPPMPDTPPVPPAL